MKKFKDIALIVFVLCLTTLIFSCGNKTTEPEIPDIGELVLVSRRHLHYGRYQRSGT